MIRSDIVLLFEISNLKLNIYNPFRKPIHTKRTKKRVAVLTRCLITQMNETSLFETHSRDVHIYTDAEALTRGAAAEFVRLARQAIAARGRFTVALSGGSTPERLYRLLARPAQAYRAGVAWERVYVFFGDERCVLPDHAESNYRMAHAALLAHVPVPAANVFRMRGEDPDANRAARDYECRLQSFFGTEDAPRFDLILLGLGTDGHTASLFPGTAALDESARLVVANRVEKFDAHRLTLTLPVINHAAHVIFLVSGAEKADAVRRVLEPQAGEAGTPASLVRPRDGELTWLLDSAAAARLTNKL